jgi:predicted glutamine amidotransferase
MSASKAFGGELLAQFAGLARLHADGWGTAWLDPETARVHALGAPTPIQADEELSALLAAPSRARMLYLRFASHGAPASPENIQPFLRDGVAFQHNGSISRAEALGLLSEGDRRHLHGTTDSEVYFAILRRKAAIEAAAPSGIEEIARGVGDIRRRFPTACLNAMLLTRSGLSVVHAAGTSPAPLDAFAQHGADLAALPPGHGQDYNVLRTTTTSAGARVVATTGVDQRGWAQLPAESVLAVTEDGVSGAQLRH